MLRVGRVNGDSFTPDDAKSQNVHPRKETTMNITVTIPDERLRDLIGSAGSGYWCALNDERHRWNRKSMTATIVEVEDGPVKVHKVTKAAFQRGLVILAHKYPHHFKDCLEDGGGDQYTGDAILQCAIFGELKYG